jgi:hypothetical protein
MNGIANSKRIIVAILLATLTAGTLDILYAIVVNSLRGASATVVLQSVASGLLGREAYAGGTATAALGLALHYLIMLAMAATFFLAASRWPLLMRRPVASGLLYGLGLYAVMTWVVAPLSRFPGKLDSTLALFAGSVFSHTVFVGLVIAIFTRHAFESVPAPVQRTNTSDSQGT